jgi:hypothetical protein
MHAQRLVVMIILSLFARANPLHVVQLVKRSAHRDRYNIRDFLVIIRVSSKYTLWELVVLFDTGSPKFWVNHNNVSSRQRIPQRGYIYGPGDVYFPDNDHVTYEGGTSLVTTVGVKEKVYLRGLARGLRVTLYVNERPAQGFDHTFGMVGVIGASPRAPFIQALGTFYFVPGNKRMWLVVGKFRHQRVCRRPLAIIPLNASGMQQGTWTVTGTATVGGQTSQPLDILLDTGSPQFELPQSLWNVFVSAISQAGLGMVPMGPSTFTIPGCDHSRLPSVTFSFPGFQHTILPRHYAEPIGGSTCQVYALGKPDGSRLVIGSHILTRVVSWWDPVQSQAGFCHTRK